MSEENVQKRGMPHLDMAKAAETRALRKAEKDAANLTLDWTRKKAIAAKCFECSNYQMAEVRRCGVKGCALYPFRHRTRLSAAEMEAWERDFKSDPINGPILARMDGGEEGEESEKEEAQ